MFYKFATWFTQNLNVIKDILWIVFTGAATVIAILTYRRARHTLFQPLKSEVVKIQTALLISLLKFLSTGVLGLRQTADLDGIITLTIYLLSKQLGFTVVDAPEEVPPFRAVLALAPDTIFVSEPALVRSADEIPPPQTDTDIMELVYNGKLRFWPQTLQATNCVQEINKFIDDPFLPADIKSSLEKLRACVVHNQTTVLIDVFNELLHDLQEQVSDQPLEVNYLALQNKCCARAEAFDPLLEEMKKSVRSYLQIDTMWKK